MLETCLAALVLASTTPVPAPLDDHGYLAVADRIQLALDPLWDERAGHYELGGGGVAATTNANLLLVHSVAALRGHRGPARQDERARRIVLAAARVAAVRAHAPAAARRELAVARPGLGVVDDHAALGSARDGRRRGRRRPRPRLVGPPRARALR